MTNKLIRVLVVEDNEVNLLVFNKFLSRLGCDVALASNGEACVEYLKVHEVDLILMDLHMPGMDGFETLQELRNFSQAPVALVTADERQEIREMARIKGIHQVAYKPLSLVQMKELLQSIFPESSFSN